MTFLLFTLLLALVWVVITGSVSLLNLVLGVAVAAIVLSVVREPRRARRRPVRVLALTALFALFLRELARSAWTVAVTVLKPRIDVHPGIFAYPLTLDGDFEIALLANLITLTPGTLSVDVSRDRRTLYVHALDCSDPDAARRGIANGFERSIRKAFL